MVSTFSQESKLLHLLQLRSTLPHRAWGRSDSAFHGLPFFFLPNSFFQMVAEYIRYHVAADQREALVEAYRQAAAELNVAPECLGYELAECEEEPGHFILRIEWTSTAAHLQEFRKGPHFAGFFGHVKSFFNNIKEMRHYHPTEVVRSK